MKLYIDDIRTEPEGWTVARTINAAINAIINFHPEEISLDHDISHEARMANGYLLVHSCDECFCAVAKFMVEFYRGKEEKFPKVTIHTGNPGGAEKLEKILTEFETEVKLSGKVLRSQVGNES